MANTSKYKVKNFEFTVNLDEGDAFGVVLTPQSSELLNDPEYIAELRAMTLALTFIRCHSIIEEEADRHQKQPIISVLQDGILEELLNFGDFARQNPFKNLSSQAEQFLFEVAAEHVARFKWRRIKGKDKSGYVYLLQSSTGVYKIGRTGDPDKRIRTFGVKLPFEVEYTCVIKTPHMFELEKLLHRAFHHKRINGEWFKLDAQDVGLIKGLA